MLASHIPFSRKVLVAVALVATVGVVAAFAQKGGRPAKVAWSSPDVYVSITSTTTLQKSLTFTSDQALQNIRLEAVPEIAKFVRIEPATFAQVPAGQPQTVRLTFSAPAGAQYGAYDGTIHLREGNTTRPQTLKTSVTFAVVPLPPDPGEAGKQTLAGIDSDRDGVRDDVQRKIAFAAPESERKRAGMIQLARAFQPYLLVTSESEAKARNVEIQRAMKCLRSILDATAAPRTFDVMTANFTNTEDRLRAYFRAEKSKGTTSGYVATSTSSVCTFDTVGVGN